MPRELFSVRPPAESSRAGRGWVPFSLVAHGAALAAVIVAPLVADGAFPPPRMPVDAALIPAVVTPPQEESGQSVPRRGSSRHSPGPTPLPVAPPVDPPSMLPPVDALPVNPGFGAAGSGGSMLDGVGLEPGPPVLPPPARPPASGRPRRISAGITAPVKIKDVRPAYPAIARQAGVEGVVVLEAVIAADGRVADVRVLHSVPLLDRAAADAVRQWMFTPATLNREPVAVVMTITVNFQLDR